MSRRAAATGVVPAGVEREHLDAGAPRVGDERGGQGTADAMPVGGRVHRELLQVRVRPVRRASVPAPVPQADEPPVEEGGTQGRVAHARGAEQVVDEAGDLLPPGRLDPPQRRTTTHQVGQNPVRGPYEPLPLPNSGHRLRRVQNGQLLTHNHR